MTKQGIIDLLYNEIENPNYKTVGDYHKGIADTLLAEFEQEKQDLLKKFVKWQAQQYKDLYHLYEEEIQKETDHDDYIWLLGRKAGIGVIRQSLRTAVERFLEGKDERNQV